MRFLADWTATPPPSLKRSSELLERGFSRTGPFVVGAIFYLQVALLCNSIYF